MMKQSVRFFAIGLMTSAILMFGYFAIFDKSAAVENIPVEELIAQIEEDDYRVISEEDFISFSLMDKDEVEANAKEKADKEKKSDKKEETTKSSDDKSSKDNDKKKQDKKSDKDKDADKSKEKSDKKKKKDKDSDKPKKVTFTTEPGVVTEDIAEILYDKKVIDDKRKFEDYLEDNGHSAYIQIGKFEVTTDMSFKEIAEVITTYPGSN